MELVNDINTPENLYTLLLYKITTKQLGKLMDFLIHHWINIEYQAGTNYLDSKVFGHAKVEHLCSKLIDVMHENGLDLKLLFNILAVGTNINNLLW